MSACLLDTDLLIAALDRRDLHHRRAAKILQAMISEATPLSLSLVNYAEMLVRPAENEQTLHLAIQPIAALGIKPVAPTPEIARDAARHRALNISLADGFAMATARALGVTVASFDRRGRRALLHAELDQLRA